MCRKLMYSVSFILVLVLALTSMAKADLVAYWPLDEGTGTIAVDVSGNGNDATINGNPTWQEGVFGQALAFDGSSDYLQASVDNVPIGSSPFTVAAWIWPTVHEFGTVVSWGVASTNQHM